MSETLKSEVRNPQNIIAIGVTIISLCALIVSVQQTQIMKEEREMMREYSRKSVWPRVEMSTFKSHRAVDNSIEKFTLSLTNSGIGPAIITDVRIRYDGKVVRNWWELFDIQKIPDSVDTNIRNRTFNNKILKIGEALEILNLNDNPSLANAFYRRLKGLEIEIFYDPSMKKDGNTMGSKALNWMLNWIYRRKSSLIDREKFRRRQK
ncbi:MAG: hypothetical protein AAFY71_06295 [Bacteroidota bacterium]